VAKPLRKKTKNVSELTRKKCVLLAKNICKTLAGYKCIYCGKGKPDVAIHAHHIYNEGVHKGMSADVDNLVSVCFTHHLGSWNAYEPSFHRNPQEMSDFMREKFPKKMIELRERSNKSIQADEYFWKQKLEELKLQYETIKRTRTMSEMQKEL
jgi:hypothetical protein